MARRYPMPQDFAGGYGGPVGGGLAALGTFAQNFIDAYQKAEERKAQRAGILLDVLSEYGGEINPEQMGEIERALGYGGKQSFPIRSAFQPTYEEVKTPAFEESEEGMNVVEEISRGKLKGYRMPSKAERETSKKKKELEIEQPYKKELLDLQTKSKEELEKIRIESREKIEEIRTQSLMDKIAAMQESVKEKIESAEKISAAGTASKEQIANANNETRMAIAELNNQIELLKVQLTTKSKEKVAEKAQEDKKAMSEIDKRRSFNDDLVKQGFLEKDGSFKTLTREQADTVKEIAESYGYQYSETQEKGYPIIGGGGFVPVIDMRPRKTKEQLETETGKPEKGKKWKRVNVEQLRKEAMDAIRRGADPIAVRKRFKEKTGEELLTGKK